jgi:ABC-type transport system substrate-binding protein
MGLKGNPSFLFEGVESIEVVDDYTLVVTKEAPDPAFLAKSTFGVFSGARIPLSVIIQRQASAKTMRAIAPGTGMSNQATIRGNNNKKTEYMKRRFPVIS